MYVGVNGGVSVATNWVYAAVIINKMLFISYLIIGFLSDLYYCV